MSWAFYMARTRSRVVSRASLTRCLLLIKQGGMPGAERLRDSETLKNMLIKQEAGNKMIGMFICVCTSFEACKVQN